MHAINLMPKGPTVTATVRVRCRKCHVHFGPFRYKCLMSDFMQREITAHLESMAGVLPHPPHIPHLALSDYHLL